MNRGLVIKSTGSNYEVETSSGEVIVCSIKGKFRTKEIRTTNPISVGDWVLFENDVKSGPVIYEIEKRRNYIIRKASNLSKESQIIAANIDQVFLIATLVSPVTTTTFMDRIIATAESFRIPITIFFNKFDLYTELELEQLEDLKLIYTSLGYSVIAISLKQKGIEEVLNPLLKNKSTLLTGHSGVGKSTFINKIEPSLNVKTDIISEAHDSGKHTTTFAEMHKLAIGGYLIDTPGVRGFGVIEIEKEEASHYFREIFQVSKNCRFNNCLHTNEPHCAVKDAVENGSIAFSRYNSYLSILSGNEEKYR